MITVDDEETQPFSCNSCGEQHKTLTAVRVGIGDGGTRHVVKLCETCRFDLLEKLAANCRVSLNLNAPTF